MTEIKSENLKSRVGNRLTVLIPARQFSINCAWTQEKSLPAIELFSCRLILTFEKVLPSEIQEFFGLTNREREELLDSLYEKRLASLDEEGYVMPSPLLYSQKRNKNGTPMLVEYKEQTESVVFELLTLSIRKAQGIKPFMFGLPEIPIPSNNKNPKSNDVIDAFSSQFRSYMDISRKNDNEKKRSNLYKVMSCSSESLLQIPVDIEFTYDFNDNAEPIKKINSFERLSGTQSRPLNNLLESHIADFLSSLEVSNHNASIESYCKTVNDNVLKNHIRDGKLDYSAWLNARSQRKTGYGTPETTALFGPLYLSENRTTTLEWIRRSLRDVEPRKIKNALWLASGVPLWGVSAEPIDEFTSRLQDIMGSFSEQASIVIFHHGVDKNDSWKCRNRFHRLINCGIMTPRSLDNIEIFLIPGIYAAVQYHGQPNSNSSITVPIGYQTHDPHRLEQLESFFRLRLGNIDHLKVSWPESLSLQDLLPSSWLQPNEGKSSSEVARAILSLRKGQD